ncbi:MAG TPA: hypothetical protein VD902_22090 [Symbiobacteriaceae bacterium]|nr:hypothetical protein [Symbiobacteriaceae bacterium]
MQINVLLRPEQPHAPEIRLDFRTALPPHLEVAFPTARGGQERLERRVSGLMAADAKGMRPITALEEPGRFRLSGPFSGRLSIRYRMLLAPAFWESPSWPLLQNVSALWDDFGFLYGRDLFPQLSGVSGAAGITFTLPPAWSVAGPRHRIPLADLAVGCWAVGRFHSHQGSGDADPCTVITHGDFPWPDTSMAAFASRIVGHLRRRYCYGDEPMLVMTRYPRLHAAAEGLGGCTSGSTMVQVIGTIPSPQGLLPGRWMRHLAHELTRLVLPGSVPMAADARWFCEGGAEYLGLKTLRQLQQLTESEYQHHLATYRAEARRFSGEGVPSLAEAGTLQPSDPGTGVISHRSPYIVHLLDRELRAATRGRHDLEAVVSSLAAAHAERRSCFGTQDLLRMLGAWGDFSGFFDRYIFGTEAP